MERKTPDYVYISVYSPCVLARIRLQPKRIPSERASQEEQNGRFIAPFCEELWVRKLNCTRMVKVVTAVVINNFKCS